MEMIFSMVFITILLTLIGSGSVFLLKIVRGKNAAPIIWNAPVSYRKEIGWLIACLLAGYHIGVHSSVFAPEASRFPALGWSLFSFFAALGWLFLYRKKLSPLVLSLIFVIFIAGIFIPLRANGFTQSFNVALQLAAAAILTLILIHEKISWTVSNLVRSILSMLPLSFINVVRIIRSIFSRDAERSQKVVGWIKTLVIMFVALIVFITILSNADPVFSNLIEEFRAQLLDRTLASIVILLLLASILSIVRNVSEEESSIGWLTYRDMVVSTAAVGTIIFIFLIVQFKYLFMGSGAMLKELNLTFSEYVRKGFNELLIATFIGGLMSYLLSLKNRQLENGNSKLPAKALNILLLLELTFLLISALRRDILYVETYGLTRVRIVGGVFLIWLFGFIFTLGFYSISKKMREAWLLASVWILTIFAWVGLNVINIDRIVVAGAPEHHQYTDYFYLMQLSEDAATEKLNLLPAMQSEVEKLVGKPQITDVEKSQLAGLKLALITFIEKRDRLYMLYADESWLLKNGWKIGRQFSSGYDYHWTGDQISISIYAESWENKLADRKISKPFKKQRQLMQYNDSEFKAYQILRANENRIFEPVNKLVRDIRYYQTEKQIPLYREENRLLHDFSYPFINVGLNRYSPEQMQRIAPSSKSYNKNSWKVFEDIDRHQALSPKSIRFYNCSNVPETIETLGIIKYGPPANLETINGEQAGITLSIPSGLQPKRANNFNINTPPRFDSRPVSVKQDHTETTDWGYGEGIVAKTVLQSQKLFNGTACTVNYSVVSATEQIGL